MITEEDKEHSGKIAPGYRQSRPRYGRTVTIKFKLQLLKEDRFLKQVSQLSLVMKSSHINQLSFKHSVVQIPIEQPFPYCDRLDVSIDQFLVYIKSA